MERKEVWEKGMKIRQATKGMGKDYKRKEDEELTYKKQDNLPPFAKPVNTMHIQMTEHSTRNK